MKDPVIFSWLWNNLGAEVTNVIAKDSDDGTNGQVVFKILGDQNTFAINENSGKIVLQSQLDRETVEEYEIIIEAQDLGNPPMTSTCLVHVKVQDENDNAPGFPVEKIELQLSEDTNIGDLAYEFRAMDQDQGVNGKVNYFPVLASKSGK